MLILLLHFLRTDAAFQSHLKKGILLNPTEYILPTEICAMVNVVLDAKNQSFKLCSVDGVDVVSACSSRKRDPSRLVLIPRRNILQRAQLNFSGEAKRGREKEKGFYYTLEKVDSILTFDFKVT